MWTLEGQDRYEIRLQRPMVLWKNAPGHQLDATLVLLALHRETRFPNGWWHRVGSLARKETRFSFAGRKDSLVHQLF
jgi:hypothetical protein